MGELGNCNICGRGAVTLYPLLPGEPAFCLEHDNLDPDEHDHDDFDIPVPGESLFPEVEPLWVTREGKRFYDERDIEDTHLINIVRFLRRGIQEAEAIGQGARAFALSFRLTEMEACAKRRGLEVLE